MALRSVWFRDTLPARLGVMPIRDFISVVLPMPLRPTTATISLSFTSRFRSRMMVLWP